MGDKSFRHFCARANLRNFILVLNGIFQAFNANSNEIKNVNLKVKWITYQSPTAGFAVKLDDGTYFSGIHMWYDFVKLIRNKFPVCIVGN